MKRLSARARARHIRFSRRRARRWSKRLAKLAQRQPKASGFARRVRRSELLDFYSQAAGFGGGRSAKVRRVYAPETFSFIEAPDETLAFMEDVVRATRQAPTIDVRHEKCGTIDLCAVSVLNALAQEARVRLKTEFRGGFPTEREMAEVVAATGLPKQLGIPMPKLEQFRSLDLIVGGQSGTTLDASSTKEKKSEAVIKYLEDVLASEQFELNRQGRKYFHRLITEVLGNAEEHSARKGWYLAAYVRKPTGSTPPDCHLAIFNLGQSIHDSLAGLPAHAALRREIERLVAIHSKGGWFGAGWKVDDLWTLYALQEGVTVYNDERGEVLGDRGWGTVEMIEAFQKLGATDVPSMQPRMCLLSGHTHVYFDGRFLMREKEVSAGQFRKIIAFNDANDLEQPPHRGTVSHLARRFPGTLISVRFFIDRDSLAQLSSPYGKVRN